MRVVLGTSRQPVYVVANSYEAYCRIINKIGASCRSRHFRYVGDPRLLFGTRNGVIVWGDVVDRSIGDLVAIHEYSVMHNWTRVELDDLLQMTLIPMTLRR